MSLVALWATKDESSVTKARRAPSRLLRPTEFALSATLAVPTPRLTKEPQMPDKTFADALNEQIANEFAASQQYVGAAVYYDAETLPRLASFFYRQALEEREHAMMMIRYLLDVGEAVHIPDIKSVETTYADGSEPVKMALQQEKRVSEEIFSLFELAREIKDYRAEQFLQWFVKEQVEEVALMGDLLNVVERSKENLLLAEDYIARESLGEESGDPTAPPVAGE
jgi:bacterioferritin B